jgi:hypothetical protein
MEVWKTGSLKVPDKFNKITEMWKTISFRGSVQTLI